jgi:hypothetical protein
VEELLSRVIDIHNVSDVRQIEIHIAEPLVLDPTFLEIEIAITKLKNGQVKI